MPEDEVPRIILNNCMYVGELDHFVVHQPFLATHGFRVTWFCDECYSEMACGITIPHYIRLVGSLIILLVISYL